MITRISRRDFSVRAAIAGAVGIMPVGFARSQAAPSPADCLPSNCTACAEVVRCCGVDGVFMHGSRKANEIALTFDACPTSKQPSFAPDLVDFLDRERVPATFFVAGHWAEANSAHLQWLAQVPYFEVALHGHLHPRLLDASAELIRSEIEDGRAALIRLGANPMPLFRPPYGDLPPELPAISRASGVLPIMWDVALGDPDPNRTADIMERDAIRWVQAGSIFVMHANGGGYCTAETVRDLVPLFRARGFSFVKVSDLVRHCALSSTRE